MNQHQLDYMNGCNECFQVCRVDFCWSNRVALMNRIITNVPSGGWALANQTSQSIVSTDIATTHRIIAQNAMAGGLDLGQLGGGPTPEE